MGLIEGLTLQQFAAMILDFGFVAGIAVVVIWTLAKSPVDFHIQFKGHLNVGRDSQPNDDSLSQVQTEQPALALEKKGA
jgi:hypothetical protein